MKKNLIIGALMLLIAFPAFASAKTILSSHTQGGFCPPPGCPQTKIELRSGFSSWGTVVETKIDANENITSTTVLAWIPPRVMKKIIATIEEIEASELYNTEEGPLIADIPVTTYTIVKSSGEELIIGQNSMGQLWLQKNRQGKYLTNLIKSFSMLSYPSKY